MNSYNGSFDLNHAITGHYTYTWLLCASCFLLLIGMIMVASASVEYATLNYGQWWYFLLRHAQHLVVALFIAMVVYHIPFQWWRPWCCYLFIVVLGLLFLVLIPGVGHIVNGSRRWLSVFGIVMQPSEPMKFFALLYFAHHLAQLREGVRIRSLTSYALPIGLFSLLCLLLLLEPDFGTFVLLMSVGFMLFFLAGLALRTIFYLGIAGSLISIALIVFYPYRWVRVVAFLNPWQDPTGSGYQLSHSLSAFGQGGFWGRGLGNSIEKQSYLPEAHTDFIFAILGEELGWIGVVLLVFLFAVVIGSILRVAFIYALHKNYFIAFSTYGIAILLALQAFINMSVNLGLLPTKGMTLPFISYGGSSLVTCCVLVAWVLRANAELRQLPTREDRC